MLSRRLEAFSNNQVSTLAQLTDARFAKPLHDLVVIFSGGSPRDMIRVCQEIVAEQLQVGGDEGRLGAQAIVRGISNFCTRRAGELLSTDVLRELTKVGRVDFTTNYVANDVFKIKANSARNKIAEWIKTGAVDKIGERRTGSRPIYHYAVTDARVAKAILPQINLPDFIEQKLGRCSECSTLLIRDWDLQSSQTCHLCSAELDSSLPD